MSYGQNFSKMQKTGIYLERRVDLMIISSHAISTVTKVTTTIIATITTTITTTDQEIETTRRTGNGNNNIKTKAEMRRKRVYSAATNKSNPIHRIMQK